MQYEGQSLPLFPKPEQWDMLGLQFVAAVQVGGMTYLGDPRMGFIYYMN